MQVMAYYIDAQTRAHAIPAAMLYSNTPSDFDYRLRQVSTSHRLRLAVKSGPVL
jgi:hypothetical protein